MINWQKLSRLKSLQPKNLRALRYVPGGGVAAGSVTVAVAATDAGVLHLGVDVEGAVAALAAVAVAASTLAAGEQVQASPKCCCSKRLDLV